MIIEEKLNLIFNTKSCNMLMISIICPIYNESNFIASCINSILAQDYPREKMEVLLVDGMSKDNTREIVKAYTDSFQFIKLLDNPAKIVPYALNIGIHASKGEVIIRIDAHCVYPVNYFSVLVDQLIRLKADNVGGVWNTLPANNTVLCKAIAIGSSHRFGIGNSLHKIGSKEIVATDTVPFGCFRRDVFDRIGFFDTDLVRNQDDEFNGRIIKNGGSIYLIPDVVIDYFARDSVVKMAKMFFQYGFFKPLVNRKLGSPATVRQFFPFLFVSGLILGPLLGLFFNPVLLTTIFVVFLYLLFSFYFSLIESIRQKEKRLLFYLPYIFFCIHVSYGWGYLTGIVMFIILRKKSAKLDVNR